MQALSLELGTLFGHLGLQFVERVSGLLQQVLQVSLPPPHLRLSLPHGHLELRFPRIKLPKLPPEAVALPLQRPHTL